MAAALSIEAASAVVHVQCAPAVVMVQPTAFGFNEETAADNAFMVKDESAAMSAADDAAAEHSAAAVALTAAGVQAVLLPGAGNADEAFPNNWLGFMPPSHGDSGCTAVLFPMATPSRQAEVRPELLRALALAPILATDTLDLRQHELARAGAVLEGTGALVLDRIARVAYCALSQRAHAKLAQAWAQHFKYTLHTFQAYSRGANGQDVPVYHTNVVLSMGAHAAVVAAECVREEVQREALLDALRAAGKHIVCITEQQVAQFAGNVLQLRPAGGGAPVWAMSSSAHAALQASGQLDELCCPPGLPAAAASDIVHVPLPTIERLGGGSMRCLLAEAWPGLDGDTHSKAESLGSGS